MSETETDVASDFAAMMAGAAEAEGADAPRNRRADATDEAPYGYHPDGRPRKSNGGRPKRSASRDELVAEAEESGEGGTTAERPRDREPGSGNGKVLKFATKAKKPDTRPVPAFHEGQIARGINKLYRKGGKIVRVMDPMIGQAIIEATKKEDEDDVTVGEAWEELARTNVRIRRFCLGLIKGGAWGQLFMAHAPILLAIIMHDKVRDHVPFMKVVESLAEPDEDSAPDEGGLPGGMTMDDVQQASRLAQEQMQKMGFPVSPEMASMAESMFRQQQTAGASAGPPPAFQRHQPHNTTRRQRRSG